MSCQPTLKVLLAEYRTLRNEIVWFDALFVLSVIISLVAVVSFFEHPELKARIICCGLLGPALMLRAGFSSWFERMPACNSVVERISDLDDVDGEIFLFDSGEIKSKARQYLDVLLFVPINLVALVIAIIAIV